MPKIKFNEIKIYYEVHGEGFPLVMIMGLSGNVDWWDPRWIEKLSEKFKVITFDNRGSGRSDIPDGKYSIKTMSEDTVGLMDALGIPKAHVLGISMGGMIAQELALNFPEKVENLILCSTSCGGKKATQPSKKVLNKLSTDRSEITPKEVAENSVDLIFSEEFTENNPDLIDLFIQQALKSPISQESFEKHLNAIMNFNTYDRLPNLETPTLILHGKKDILVPPKNGPILEQRIPNSRLVFLENSAHGLIEETEEVLESILRFLSESS